MSNREFENTLDDYNEKLAEVYFDANGQLKPNERFKSFEVNTYKKYFENYRDADFSVYTGSGGVAYVNFLLSTKTADPELKQKYLKSARKMLPRPEVLNHRRETFLTGAAGPIALRAAIEYELGDRDESNYQIYALSQSIPSCSDPDMSDEFLYGRVGILFGLMFMRKYVGDCLNKPHCDPGQIQKLFKMIVQNGISGAKNMAGAPLMYQWHDKQYLGAAHGVAGILYQLLLAREYDCDNYVTGVIRDAVDYLLTLKLASGNYPSRVGNARDELVQWCHGAPGFVHLFCEAYEVYNDDKYLKAALDCGEVVWKRGLLTKGYSICHGVAGNAYVFLKLYKATKLKKHLFRAIKFAEWCTDYTSSHENQYPDRANSLYEGVAGRLCLIIDIQDPLNANFPGYEV